jgi:hypothetical protein
VALVVSIVLLLCCSSLSAVPERCVPAPKRDGQPADALRLRLPVSPMIRLEDRPEGTDVHSHGRQPLVVRGWNQDTAPAGAEVYDSPIAIEADHERTDASQGNRPTRIVVPVRTRRASDKPADGYIGVAAPRFTNDTARRSSWRDRRPQPTHRAAFGDTLTARALRFGGGGSCCCFHVRCENDATDKGQIPCGNAYPAKAIMTGRPLHTAARLSRNGRAPCARLDRNGGPRAIIRGGAAG